MAFKTKYKTKDRFKKSEPGIRSNHIHIVLNDTELELLEKLMDYKGLSRSSVIRNIILEEARKCNLNPATK